MRFLHLILVAAGFFISSHVVGNVDLRNNDPGEKNTEDQLKVQLSWTHQAQFAGAYVGVRRGYFRDEHLDVEFIPGGPNTELLRQLQEGNVDVAIGWASNNEKHLTRNKQITNIAQIFTASSFKLFCRISSGVYEAGDLKGKVIGINNKNGVKSLIHALLKNLSIPQESVTIVSQNNAWKDLVTKEVDCVTGMEYNQYWNLTKTFSSAEILVIDLEKFGVFSFVDGLWVKTTRLDSPEFRELMVRFLRAIKKGWYSARSTPRFAEDAVMSMDPDLDRDHQAYQLQSVLSLIPSDPSQFGLFDLERFNNSTKSLDVPFYDQLSSAAPRNVWTHEIYNDLQKSSGSEKFLTPSTLYYVKTIISSEFFKFFVFFGVFTFAMTGVLEGVNRGYGFYGCTALALITSIGGGTMRDVIIGGDRLNLYWVNDIRYAAGVLVVTILTMLALMIRPNAYKTKTFKAFKENADVLGFSVLATLGAVIAISSGLEWYWAPMCGALTCAGGGALRDIVVNSEPRTFKGVIYEEVAALGGLYLTAGLFIANFFPHSSLAVVLTVYSTTLFIIVVRLVNKKYDVRYPVWLVGRSA
jgi:NitT/TauT family transport system substrate-binding protein